MDKGSTIQELSRSLTLPQTREGLPITMEATLTMEEVPIIILTQGMGMGMEQATIRTIPIQPHPPRGTKATLLVSSAGRLDIMPRSALK